MANFLVTFFYSANSLVRSQLPLSKVLKRRCALMKFYSEHMELHNRYILAGKKILECAING